MKYEGMNMQSTLVLALWLGDGTTEGKREIDRDGVIIGGNRINMKDGKQALKTTNKAERHCSGWTKSLRQWEQKRYQKLYD